MSAPESPAGHEAGLAERALARVEQIATVVGGMTGWRRRWVALGAGAFSALALAPFFLWPILALTLPVLIWLIDGALARGAALSASAPTLPSRQTLLEVARIGWLFGFGYFLAGLFWIGVAFLVEAEKFAVLLPFAVTLMPAGLALFYSAAAALAALAWRPGLERVLALALALGAMEWLKGHVLTGFPWNTLGYALTHPLILMQSASLLGIYALTILTVLILAGPLGYLTAGPRKAIPAVRSLAIAAAILVVPLAILAAGGALRLSTYPVQEPSGPLVRIVQPSIPQREKWRPENQGWIFQDHIVLSGTDPSGRPGPLDGFAAVVWPEAAMPFLPLEEPRALAGIAAMLPAGGHLVTGALRQEKAVRGRRIFNSLIVIDKAGRPAAIYDKIHLVPFGEYLPFQATLEAIGLEQLTRIRGGFDTGNWPRKPLSVQGLPALGPLVCYEAIFPGAAVSSEHRPEILVNVTNDGWFGRTTGPHQHFHQARVRAVEEGLPLVRAANNGISAMIDPLGRVLARLELDVRGVMDVHLPRAIARPFYAQRGDLLFWIFIGSGGILVLARRSRARSLFPA